jgi:hypothetical protein
MWVRSTASAIFREAEIPCPLYRSGTMPIGNDAEDKYQNQTGCCHEKGYFLMLHWRKKIFLFFENQILK